MFWSFLSGLVVKVQNVFNLLAWKYTKIMLEESLKELNYLTNLILIKDSFKIRRNNGVEKTEHLIDIASILKILIKIYLIL